LFSLILNVIICLIVDWNLKILCWRRYFLVGWRSFRGKKKIAMGFRRMEFVEIV